MEIQDTIRLQKIYAAVMEMALQSHSAQPEKTAAEMFYFLTGVAMMSIGKADSVINENKQQRIAATWEWLFGKEEPKVPRRQKKRYSSGYVTRWNGWSHHAGSVGPDKASASSCAWRIRIIILFIYMG